MNKRAAQYGLIFYVATVFFFWQDKIFSDPYLLGLYILVCGVFIYFIFRKKPS